jgi:hypothetical protein
VTQVIAECTIAEAAPHVDVNSFSTSCVSEYLVRFVF